MIHSLPHVILLHNSFIFMILSYQTCLLHVKIKESFKRIACRNKMNHMFKLRLKSKWIIWKNHVKYLNFLKGQEEETRRWTRLKNRILLRLKPKTFSSVTWHYNHCAITCIAYNKSLIVYRNDLLLTSCKVSFVEIFDRFTDGKQFISWLLTTNCTLLSTSATAKWPVSTLHGFCLKKETRISMG